MKTVPKTAFRVRVGWVSVLSTLVLTACASVSQNSGTPPLSAAEREVLSGDSLLGHAVQPDELPDIDLFAVTPEMAAFATHAVKNADSIYDKVKALHDALILPETRGGRGIVYSAYTTETPAITFAIRRANCLSFTLLFVALARHLKLDAQVNQVDIPPQWDLRNHNSLIVLRHVDLRIPLSDQQSRGLPAEHVIVDLEMDRYKPIYQQHAISDALAAAQFYNNHGMELMTLGNTREAFLYLRKALQEDMSQDFIWNNLATLYQRAGLLPQAKAAFEHGLQLNQDPLPIMDNLARLYGKMGYKRESERYSELADRYRLSNPYYQYALALSAVEGGDYEDAKTYIHRALSLNQEDYRFYQLSGTIYQHQGHDDKASRMMAKADALQRHHDGNVDD